MNWKHVFDGNKTPVMKPTDYDADEEKIARIIKQKGILAKEAGYKFMAFNKVVYFLFENPIIDHFVPKIFPCWLDTGLRVNDKGEII